MGSEITGATSAELRAQFVELAFRPQAEAIFRTRADVQSVILAVAQFWADEADDAVHIELLPARDQDPVWPACLEDRDLYDIEEDGGETYAYPKDELTDLIEFGKYPYLDDNGSAITAFGAYCLEACDQEMSLAEAYLPYAIARRGPQDEVEVEVVGTVHQPHWEDRFDVGFDEEPPPTGAVSMAEAGDEAPSMLPGGSFRAWMRRLFGGAD